MVQGGFTTCFREVSQLASVTTGSKTYSEKNQAKKFTKEAKK
jgi:hypothetical protein